jgi:hypothetical protein
MNSRADIIIQTIDVTATPGTEFTIPITIYGASEQGTPIGSANIVFTFDTAAVQYMQFLNFNPITPQNQWYFSGNNNTGIVAANWLEPNLLTVTIPDGSALYYVKFKAKKGACPFTFITYEFTDEFYNMIPTTPDHGSFASIQQVQFQVNMRDQAISPQGIFLAGTFNGWSTTATQMTVSDSTIYSVTVPLISDSIYYYKFVNGNTTGGYETVPAECGVFDGNTYNRAITPPAGDTTLPEVCFSSCAACPPQSLVTFQVDMRDQIISPQGVHLAGSFNNWSTTATPMTLSASTVYAVSLLLLTDSSCMYKFVNGNTSGGYEVVPAECGVLYQGGYVRSLTVPEVETVLTDICFSECDTCPPQSFVTFRVDMNDQSVDPNGVHLAGTFNNWSPSATLMNNLGNDVFGVTIPLVIGTSVEYRFVNGNTTSGYEVVPSNCGVMGDDGMYNRYLEVPGFDSTLIAVCFSNCSECLTIRSITFTVDMDEQDISPDGVHLAGSFNNFNPSSITMTNQGNDVFFAIVDLFEDEYITYRFVNGDDTSGFETVPSGCGVDDGNGVFNRFLTVPGENMTLPEVCFSSCDDCTQQPWEKEITFRVDLNKVDVSADGIYLAGTFNDWNPAGIQLIHLGNNIYSTTMTLNENDIHQYRFVNGNTADAYETVPAECGFEGESGGLERQLIIPGNDTILDAVCFSECSACITYEVKLQVDMMKETVSVYGVYLAGSFNNWDTENFQMTSSGSTIYEATLQVYEGDTLLYRFVNGIESGDMEQVPSDCGWIYNGQDYSRMLIPTVDTIMQEACFSWCDPCDVGMGEEYEKPLIGQIFPNPANARVTIPVNLQEAATFSVHISDAIGHIRKIEVFDLMEGYHELTIDTGNLPEGLYIVQSVISEVGLAGTYSCKLLINR